MARRIAIDPSLLAPAAVLRPSGAEGSGPAAKLEPVTLDAADDYTAPYMGAPSEAEILHAIASFRDAGLLAAKLVQAGRGTSPECRDALYTMTDVGRWLEAFCVCPRGGARRAECPVCRHAR